MLQLFGIAHSYIIYFTYVAPYGENVCSRKSFKINLYFILNYATMICNA